MGKATITSEVGAGEYIVDLVFDRAAGDAEISKLTAENADLQTLLDGLAVERTSARVALAITLQELSAAIAAGDQATRRAANAAYQSAREEYLAIETKIKMTDLLKASNSKRAAYIQSKMPEDRSTTAWCADYTEGLSGDIGTVEAGREDGRGEITLQPGYGNAAGYTPSRDGMLRPIVTMSPAQAFVNYVTLPGAGKWAPRYRTGVVSAIDTDLNTADIDVDSTPSSHQALETNQAPVLSGIPVVYMECHAAAFEVGDHVVIEFEGQDWLSARVIGFVSHPVPCAAGFYCKTADARYLHLRWKQSTLSYVATETGAKAFGLSDWHDENGDVYTWNSQPNPYCEATGAFPTGCTIWKNGEVWSSTVIGDKLQGIGIATRGDGTRWLVAVASEIDFVGVHRYIKDRCYSAPVVGGSVGTFVLKAESADLKAVSDYENTIGYRFSQSGLIAVSNRRLVSDTCYHKTYLNYDVELDSASFDHTGPVAQVGSVYSIDHDRTRTGIATDPLPGMEVAGLRTEVGEYRYTFHDFRGDTEITGQIRTVRTRVDTEAHQQYENADGYRYSHLTKATTHSNLVTVTLDGAEVLKDFSVGNGSEYREEHYAGYGSPDIDVTRQWEWSMVRRLFLEQIDLRSKFLQHSYYEQTYAPREWLYTWAWATSSWAANNFAPGGVWTSRWGGGLSALFDLAHAARTSGGEINPGQSPPEVPSPDWLFSSLDFDPVSIHSVSTDGDVYAGTGESPWYIPTLGDLQSDGDEALGGQAAGVVLQSPSETEDRSFSAYKGDHTRVFYSLPICKEARGAIAWVDAGSPFWSYLTGESNPEGLTSQPADGSARFTPIGCV